MKKPIIQLIAAFIGLVLAGPVSAQVSNSAIIAEKMDQFVTDHAIEFIDSKLTDEQTTHLKLIAHQAAVASVCDEFELDEARFVEAFGMLAHEQEADMSDAEKQYFERHLMVTYGVLVGGALSAAALDPAGYCEQAEGERTEAGEMNWMVWQTGQ